MEQAEKTLSSMGRAQLGRLCAAAGLGNRNDEIDRWFSLLSASWGMASPGQLPLWSGIGDDCSPLEWSVVLRRDERPEMRVLTECHEEPASPSRYWHAAERLTQSLAKETPLAIERIERVRALFEPQALEDEVFFAAFHAVVFWADHTPMVKVYLNPTAHGFASALDVTEEALTRLGFPRAWRSLRALVDDRHVAPAFLSLDLSAGEGNRVKVYLRHRNVPFESVERAAASATGYVPGDLRSFFELMAGERAAQGVTRAVLTTHYFTAENTDCARGVALQMPARPYTPDDNAFSDRVRELLRRDRIPPRMYEQCLRALFVGDPGEGAASQSWASFSRTDGEPRVTVYFSPQFYARTFGPLSLDPVSAWPRPRGAVEPAGGLVNEIEPRG